MFRFLKSRLKFSPGSFRAQRQIFWLRQNLTGPKFGPPKNNWANVFEAHKNANFLSVYPSHSGLKNMPSHAFVLLKNNQNSSREIFFVRPKINWRKKQNRFHGQGCKTRFQRWSKKISSTDSKTVCTLNQNIDLFYVAMPNKCFLCLLYFNYSVSCSLSSSSV